MLNPIIIQSENKGPKLLISAGVHGDEYEPMLAAIKLIEMLEGKLINGSVTIVVAVNHTAVAQNSRYGSDGLDLARVCPGNATGSVSEQSAAAISNLIRESDFYIDMHTGGRLFNIYPLSGYMLHSNKKILEIQQQMAQAFNLPVIWGTDSAPQGRTLSVARDANVPAIYVEYGGGNFVKEEIITAYTEGCLNVLNKFQMITEYSNTVSVLKYWVEDDTPNNGHLQAKLPASMQGIFIPSVKLGQSVSAGQLWGTITDVISGHKKEINADETGIVLFIRDVASVKAGDSLGGILPLNKNTIKTIVW